MLPAARTATGARYDAPPQKNGDLARGRRFDGRMRNGRVHSSVTPAPRIAREGGDQRQVVKQEIVPNV